MPYGTVVFGGSTYGEGVLGDWPAVVTVEVAFTTLPGDPNPVWEDISEFVSYAKVKGAHRQRELDRFENGELDLTLDNSDGRFHPNNTASPYSPNVRPMRRIRVRATWAGVTHDLFNGYVEDWPPKSLYPKWAETPLKATDGFLPLTAAPLDGSAYEIEVRADNPLVWWRLNDDDASGPMVDSSGNGYDGRLESEPSVGGDSLVAGQSLPSMSMAFLSLQRGRYDSTDGTPFAAAYPLTIEQLVRFPQGMTPGHQVLFFLVSDDGLAQWQVFLDNSPGRSDPSSAGPDPGPFLSFNFVTGAQDRAGQVQRGVIDGKPHVVTVVATSATDIVMYVDGAGPTTLFYTGHPAIPAGPLKIFVGNAYLGNARLGVEGQLAETSIYNTALSADRVAAHAAAALTAWKGDLSGARVHRILDAAGWPAALRDIDAGQSTLQSQTFGGALESIQAVAEAELGDVFMKPDGSVRFRDRHTLLKAPYTTAVCEFSDQATGVNYDDIEPDFAVDMIRNLAGVARAGGSVQRAKNTTSKGKYFARKYDKTGLLLEKDAEARDQANFIVARYADPPFRYGQLELNPAGTEIEMFPLLLGLALGDRVTITEQPPGFAGAQSRDMHIEGITHEMVGGGGWTTTYQLSPVDPQTYFVLGTSTLGGSDVLGH